jgi:glycosyltransferase involved in cell wall biosynthesis
MTRPLALIEPHADQAGGHHGRTLLSLAAAHGDALVLVPPLTAPSVRDQLAAAGAEVVTGPRGLASVLLNAAAQLVSAGAQLAGMAFSSRRWPGWLRRTPHQLGLLSAALHESAAVRTARHLRPDAAVVILTAAPGLHTVVGLLGGRHQRFIHEITTTEDLPLRLLGRLAGRGPQRVLALAPTEAVHDELRERFPGLPTLVRPYAVAAPQDRITAQERVEGRHRLGLAERHTAIALVGGWWPAKDLLTVDRALSQLTRPIHLLVTGRPLDDQRLGQWARLPLVRVRVLPAPASDTAVRDLYAAADAALVSRNPGVGKESGLVTDALRFGIPLVCSDHHHDLTRQLTGKSWAALFPSGDAAQLADLLDRLADRRLPAPGPDARAALGVPTPQDQVAFLVSRQQGEQR